jgi:hypothetical protein
MEAKRLSKDTLDLIQGLPIDLMFRKHESWTWSENMLEHLYLFDILDKPVLLNPFVKPNVLSLISASISSDERFMSILLKSLKEETIYMASAIWHDEAKIYLTFAFHATYFKDIESYTMNFE